MLRRGPRGDVAASRCAVRVPARAGADMSETALLVRSVEMLEVAIPLVRPFRTSFGEEGEKRAILVTVVSDDTVGWGECVTSTEPRYSEEWLDGAWIALADHLVPSLLASGPILEPEDVGRRLAWVRGHRMAKAALEAAVLDAWLRAQRRSLVSYLGGVRDRVECGV